MNCLYFLLLLGAAIYCDALRAKRPLLIRGPIRVISDRVTQNIVSGIKDSIMERDRREIPGIPVLKDTVEAMKIRMLLRRPRGSFPKLPRTIDEDVLDRLDESAERRYKLQRIAHEYSREKRISSSQTSRKPVPIPASFLSAAARIVVPAQPEQRSPARSSMIPESGPRPKIEEAKRSIPY